MLNQWPVSLKIKTENSTDNIDTLISKDLTENSIIIEMNEIQAHENEYKSPNGNNYVVPFFCFLSYNIQLYNFTVN